jgi:5'-nucleotidase
MTLLRKISFTLFYGLFLAGFAAAEPGPLRILLTNDDGYDAPGIEAVRKALIDAGHDVTVVAPLSNQSGSGVRVTTSGEISLLEQGDGIWSVGGSPADAVLVALRYLMKDNPPDLVVSGANFGQNLAYGSSSGTVGAATMAMYAGLPAIAISVGVRLSERRSEPLRYPSTFTAFPGAAAFVAELIEDLQASEASSGRMLPEHTILNINYPALTPGRIQGVRFVTAARGGDVVLDYDPAGDAGNLQIKFAPLAVPPEQLEGTDIEAFRSGHIAITVFDGIWDAGENVTQQMQNRLGDLLR